MQEEWCNVCYAVEYQEFTLFWENSYCSIYFCPCCGNMYIYFKSRKKYLLAKSTASNISKFVKRELEMEPKRKQAERERK
jgi:hypothetical protein